MARRLLDRMNHVKRRGSTKAKVTPEDYKQLKVQFLADIRIITEFESIPSGLILNWVHTGLTYVPTSPGKEHVKTAASCLLSSTAAMATLVSPFVSNFHKDVFLPPQLINGGKTLPCLPKAIFYLDWRPDEKLHHKHPKLLGQRGYNARLCTHHPAASHTRVKEGIQTGS